MRQQCEWCSAICDEDELTQDVVCSDCKDNSASCGINKSDKKALTKGMSEAFKILMNKEQDAEKTIAKAKGCLIGTLAYCCIFLNEDGDIKK